ncbi:hypothetical protein [Pseudomonas plecoglossicida]|uniref:hypothetical protein n=1 Tax=Pseudomonas plecoglossicida TaxID=70775 RepID=UPI000689398B|nr:hypothetical protein [Pseudomonas plecoglossicida]
MDSGKRGTLQRLVEYSPYFDRLYRGLSKGDLDKIDDFTEHFTDYGFVGLPGKLKPSWHVPGADREYETKKQFAVANYIWHYHVGIPYYQAAKDPKAPYKVSDYVVHFQRFPGDMHIRLVDLDFHPMRMPKQEYL